MRISDTGIIELKGMEFHAFHGCLDSERKDGNTFRVDLEFEYSITPAAQSDALRDAVDYSRIYGIVSAQMAIPSNLLENLAARIVDAVKEYDPRIGRVRVKVGKKNPPVGGAVDWSIITCESE